MIIDKHDNNVIKQDDFECEFAFIDPNDNQSLIVSLSKNAEEKGLFLFNETKELYFFDTQKLLFMTFKEQTGVVELKAETRLSRNNDKTLKCFDLQYKNDTVFYKDDLIKDFMELSKAQDFYKSINSFEVDRNKVNQVLPVAIKLVKNIKAEQLNKIFTVLNNIQENSIDDKIKLFSSTLNAFKDFNKLLEEKQPMVFRLNK